MFEGQAINTYKLLLIILLCIAIIFLYLAKGRFSFKIARGEFCIFVIFIFIAMHSFVYSFDQSRSLHIYVGIAWLFFVYLTKEVFGYDLVFKYLSIIFKCVAYSALLANMVVLMVYGLSALTVEGNYHGISNNANYLATFVAVFSFPVALSRISIDEGKASRLLTFILIFCCVVLIVLSRSRTSSVAILVTALLYYVYFMPESKSSLNSFIKLTIMLIAAVVALYFLYDLFVNKYIGKDVFSTRSRLFELRIEAISQRPFTGWGFSVNNFNEYDLYNKFNYAEKGNTLLAVLEELGIILGSIFIIYLARVLYRGVKAYSMRNNTLAFALAIISSAVLLQGETWLFNFYGIPALFLWAIIFLSLGFNSSRLPRHLIVR